MNQNTPHYFTYKYNEGPLPLDSLKDGLFQIGNCRRAIQDYLYRVHNFFMPPEQILLPEGFTSVGLFITQDYMVDRSLYLPGDIVYAEKIRDKKGNLIYKGKDTFKNKMDWIVSLHTAVIVDKQNIYHATSIEGHTCFWSFKKFTLFYKIVAVKRVLYYTS